MPYRKQHDSFSDVMIVIILIKDSHTYWTFNYCTYSVEKIEKSWKYFKNNIFFKYLN